MLLLGSALQLVMALTAAFMPTFATFSVFRFLTAVAVTHAYLTAFVISEKHTSYRTREGLLMHELRVSVMEMIGPKYRTAAGVFYQIWFAIGFMLLPGYAYVIRDFRYLQIAMAVPVVVCVGFVL